MWLAEKYIDYVKEQAVEKPEESWGKLLLGFQANKLRTKLLPKKGLAKGYQRLEAMMMAFVADSLAKPDSYVWGNIFAPCEIIQCLGLHTLSIECLACYLSGYHLEDYLIDYAQNSGMAPTLCSYHKTFVGAIDSGVIPVPRYAVTTSLSCDGNLNTFRYLEKKKGVPFTFLDVPYRDDKASVEYLAGQLRELAGRLEEQFGRRFDEEKLRESLRIENENAQGTGALLRAAERTPLSGGTDQPSVYDDGHASFGGDAAVPRSDSLYGGGHPDVPGVHREENSVEPSAPILPGEPAELF